MRPTPPLRRSCSPSTSPRRRRRRARRRRSTFTISPSSGTAFRNNGHPGTTFTFNASRIDDSAELPRGLVVELRERARNVEHADPDDLRLSELTGPSNQSAVHRDAERLGRRRPVGLDDANRHGEPGMSADDERGQGLVEFALVLPIFLMLLLGVFDLGMAIYRMNGTSQAAREIARAASVHPCHRPRQLRPRRLRRGPGRHRDPEGPDPRPLRPRRSNASDLMAA